MKFFRAQALPIAAAAILLFAAMFASVQAAYPTLWSSWVVANASITPSPAPTGYAGAVAVVQATAAPTPQSGYLDVTHVLSTFFNANAGTANNNYQWACGAVSTICDFGQNSGATISSIPCTVLGINNGTNNTANTYLCIDTSGNIGSAGSFTANAAIRSSGSIVGGNGTAATCTSGDGCFSRSTTTGALNLGGSSSHCLQDYGSTTASTMTIACATNINGLIGSSLATGNNYLQWSCGATSTVCALGQNSSATISSINCTVLGINNGTNNTANSFLCLDTGGNLGIGGSFTAASAIRSAGAIVGGNGTAPTCASGDGCFSRSTTTGQINVGGSSSKCSFDYGTSTASTGTIGCPLNVTGATAVTGSFTYSTPAPGCTSNSNLPCGGVISCTTVSSATCSAAFTVPAAGAQCTANYDSQSHGSPTVWLPVYQNGSGATSRSWTGTFTTSQSNSLFFDYNCV